MNIRELIILLLGFAITAVIMRGLFIAFRARRGQIRLAIDKNIPQGVDLESLELAELPGGGARTVSRAEQQDGEPSAVEAANLRAKLLNLGEAEAGGAEIPVLMDAVEISQPRAEALTEQVEFADEFAADDESSVEDSLFVEAPAFADGSSLDEGTAFDDDSASVEDSFAADDSPALGDAEIFDEQKEEPGSEALDQAEDPDSVLFDYEEDEPEAEQELSSRGAYDALAAVRPDYRDSEGEFDAVDPEAELDYEEEEAQFNASVQQEPGHDLNYRSDGNNDVDENDSKDSLESYDEADAEESYRQQSDTDESDDQFDDFSMTAGERIGQVTPIVPPMQPSALFDDDDKATADAAKPRRRSLFDLFGRKAKQQPAEAPAAIPAAPSVAEIEEVDGAMESLEPEVAVAEPGPVSMEPSEVIVINVMAKEGYEFSGHDLLQVLVSTGLKFGGMNIFHQRLSNDPKAPVLFSVANILNPGTFDLNNMDEFSTTGVSLFLALPSVANNLQIFEQMLLTAQQIQAALGGELRDDQRNDMTAQTIEHYRQRVSDFELRRLKAVGGRG